MDGPGTGNFLSEDFAAATGRFWRLGGWRCQRRGEYGRFGFLWMRLSAAEFFDEIEKHRDEEDGDEAGGQHAADHDVPMTRARAHRRRSPSPAERSRG